MLQETHWLSGAEAVWSSGVLTDVAVVSSAARPGARGGPSGGVAVLLPHPWRLVRSRTMVP
eukprot:3196439-Lingulodinium_polyedra.AAC.1